MSGDTAEPDSSGTRSGNEASDIDGYLKRVARNAGITGAGNILGQAISPVIGAITTRALGAALYGVYTQVDNLARLLSELARLGFGGTVVRFTATYRGRGEMAKVKGVILLALKIALIAAGLVTLGMLLLAGPISRIVIDHPEAAGAFRFYAVAVLLTALYGTFIAGLNGFQQQQYIVLSNSVVSNLVKLVTLVIFLWAGLDLYAALASSLLQDLVIVLLGGYFLVRVFPDLRRRQVKPVVETKKLWSYALTIFATSLFYKHTFNLDLVFLGFYRTAEEVGLYGLVLKLQPLIYMPTYAISEIFNPIVAELYAQEKISELGSLYKAVSKWTAALSLPIFLVVVLFYDTILHIFGKEFTAAATPLIVLAVGNAVINVIGMSGYVINMIGKPRLNLYNTIVTAFLSLLLFVLLIPPYGPLGAALSYVSSTFLVNIIRTVQIRHIVGIHPFKWSLLKVVAATVAALGTTIGFRALVPSEGFLMQLPALLVCMGTYVGVTILLGFDREDKVILEAVGSRIPFRRKKK